MSTALIRFEVELPLATTGSAQDMAVQQFKTNMRQLSNVYEAQFNKTAMDGTFSQSSFCSGYITAAQQAAALNNLNTLNAALQAAGSPAVLCTAWNVTSEP